MERRPHPLPALLLLAGFALLVAPALLTSPGGRAQAVDERIFHLEVVRTFAAQWPAPDLRDYPSATSPGFHLVLAMVHRATDGSIAALRLATACAGALLLLLVWWRAARWAGAWMGVAAALPFCCCGYTVAASAWVSTDLAGLLPAAASVALLAGAPPTAGVLLSAGACTAAAVFVRQTALWAAAPIVAAAFAGSPAGRWLPDCLQWSGDLPRRRGRLLAAALALALPLATLATLGLLWGGAVPARFRAYHGAGLNGAATTFCLAALGAWGVMLLPGALHGSGLRDLLKRRAVAAAIILGVGAAAALLPASAYHVAADTSSPLYVPAPGETAVPEVGRYGGVLWALAQAWDARSWLPHLPGRSLPLAVLAFVGAFCTLALWDRAARVGRGRHAAVIVVTIGAFAMVQALNSQTFERYFDPFLLLALGWLAALGVRRRDDVHAVRTTVGLLLLSAVQLALTLGTVYSEPLAALLRRSPG